MKKKRNKTSSRDKLIGKGTGFLRAGLGLAVKR